jgi:hypothetical protein
MPLEWSHNLWAAGLHGASSARSTALALVVQAPRSTDAATIIFMLRRVPHFFGRGLPIGKAANKPVILCGAQMPHPAKISLPPQVIESTILFVYVPVTLTAGSRKGSD